jgi:hypothetical protein
MLYIINYEIKSEISIVSDDLSLRINHPKGAFQARLKNIVRDNFTTPFLLSLQISFDAPSIKEAEDIAEGKLGECLNMLALATGGSFRWHRTKQIVDGAPGIGMRDCLLWADSVGHEDPQPFLNENVIASIERLMEHEIPPALRRAMRWYRIGVDSWLPEDQFQYFWFALEILAEFNKTPERVNDRCPVCQSPLYCEKCDHHPTHKPYPKQAIKTLIKAVDKDCDEETLISLDKARNALMHGATLKEIETELDKSREDIVDVLGEILFKALINQFPKQLFTENIRFGAPNTYIHRTMSGIAHVNTIVPLGQDGELDLDGLKGINVTLVTDYPPQSGQPSIIAMTTEQHKRLGLLIREKGDHQELCKRVYQKVKHQNGKVLALILSTDMAIIKSAIKKGENGNWQDLFREILNASD